jgi:predicted ArsR family transcriptional regulator
VQPIATLSRARREVLELLRRHGRLTLAALVELTALHENTLREHLDGLAADGLARKERGTPHGPGRPPLVWVASLNQARGHTGMATALAQTLRRVSRQPRAEATQAGVDWGRQAAHEAPVGTATAEASVREEANAIARLTALLRDLGFSLEVGPERERPDEAGAKAPTSPPGRSATIRLTRCPLLDAALADPEIVCTVHEGLVVGALAEFGDRERTVNLTPFAEPGACVLTIGASSTPKSRGRQ